MTTCYDEGTLRASLDQALSPLEQATLDAHLGTCSACRERRGALQRTAAQVAGILGTAPHRDAQTALQQVYAVTQPIAVQQSRKSSSMNQTKRRIFSSLAALAVVAILFSFPPVRAAADSFLQLFRARNVVFVPFDSNRAEQIRNLNMGDRSLFISEPKRNGDAAETKTVNTVEEAAAIAGFPVTMPTLPESVVGTPTINVRGAESGEATVDVQTARMALSALNITDVELPDALGQSPIRVEAKPTVAIQVGQGRERVTVIQTISPDITLPEGVDLAVLGRAALRVSGLTPDQADAMSRSIDWSSTLVIPLPMDMNEVQQINVNGAQGLLMSKRGDGSMLYLQRGEQVLVIEGNNVSGEQLLEIARSM